MKKYIFTAVFILILSFSFQAVMSQSSRYEGKIVRHIEFTGLYHNSEASLAYNMLTTEGFPLKADEVRRDIKSVFDKGKLEKVEVEIEEYENGVRLRFICLERPVIDSIVYRGLGEVGEADIQNDILCKQGDVYRKDLAEKSSEIIMAKHVEKGLFNASVSYRVEELDDSRDVKLEFIIDEGEEISVEKISILGAKKIYEGQLKSIMETKEDSFISSGSFEKEKFEQDKAMIIAFYKQNGYLDAQIVDEKVEYEWKDPSEKKERCIFITLSVQEGDRYYFDGYTVNIVPDENGKTVFTPDSFTENFLQTEKGDVFNNTKFEADRNSINLKYSSQGYIFNRIMPQKTLTEMEVKENGVTEKRKYVKVDFTIVEGSQAYIESIIIKGNRKTLDKVIRREILCREGELFDSTKVNLSREKVYNLGYFKEVNIEIRPGSREGYMNLVMDVVEQPSATISVGGGYGTSSGFSIFSEVTEKNFLGKGQTAGVKFEYGPLRSSVTLSFIEPWLFDDIPLSLNTSVFYNYYTIETSSMFSSSETAKYKKMGIGYSLGLSYRFWYYYTAGLTWIHEYKKYLDPTGNNTDTVFVAASHGIQEKRTVRLYWSRDSKDNYLNPTRGSLISMSASFSGGILGGQDHFVRLNPDIDFYWSPFHLPFLKDWKCVFEFNGRGTFLLQPVGHVKQDPVENEWLEAEDRLLIGGPETVRGWDYYDSSLPDSWASTGLFHRILYGAEFRIPLHPQMLWAALFFDAGALFSDEKWESQMDFDSIAYEDIQKDKEDKELYTIRDFIHGRTHPAKYFKYGYGFGFRIQIPMMPLRFWFGRKAEFEDGAFRNIGGMTFQFQIGDIRY